MDWDCDLTLLFLCVFDPCAESESDSALDDLCGDTSGICLSRVVESGRCIICLGDLELDLFITVLLAGLGLDLRTNVLFGDPELDRLTTVLLGELEATLFIICLGDLDLDL